MLGDGDFLRLGREPTAAIRDAEEPRTKHTMVRSRSLNLSVSQEVHLNIRLIRLGLLRKPGHGCLDDESLLTR